MFDDKCIPTRKEINVGGWRHVYFGIFPTHVSIFLSPDWGPASRTITHDEAFLYISGLASPVPVGFLSRDFLY